MATRGNYVHNYGNYGIKFSGASWKFSQNIDGFRQNDSQGF